MYRVFPAVLAAEALVQADEDGQHDEDEDCRRDGYGQISRAYDESDSRDGPQSGRRRKAADIARLLVCQYGAGA